MKEASIATICQYLEVKEEAIRTMFRYETDEKERMYSIGYRDALDMLNSMMFDEELMESEIESCENIIKEDERHREKL